MLCVCVWISVVGIEYKLNNVSCFSLKMNSTPYRTDNAQHIHEYIYGFGYRQWRGEVEEVRNNKGDREQSPHANDVIVVVFIEIFFY